MRDDEFVEMMKSTIVRSDREPWSLPLVRPVNGALSALAPSLAARLAERMFLTPARQRRPAAEIELLASARARPVRIADGSHIQTWRWGTGPGVLVVHGWGGRGTQLASFVEPLVARGFSVIAFDAPGHGASEGRRATITMMVAAARAVAEELGPIRGVIAHSVGAIVAARALHEGLAVDALVFLAPAAHLAHPATRFRRAFGFSRHVDALMRARIERRVGLPWAAFDISTVSPARAVPLLVVHDRGDGEVPWQDGVSIARGWPGATLLTTDGLGHRRILLDPRVMTTAVSFLTARVRQGVAAPVSTPAIRPVPVSA